MIARLLVLLCVAALAAPSAAVGQAFDPLPTPQPQQPTTVVAEEEEGDGLSPTQQLLIALSGILLVGAIAYAILRDARGAAPADVRGAPTAAGEQPQPRGSRAPAAVRNRQNRAKAKAARQARKKSRKR